MIFVKYLAPSDVDREFVRVTYAYHIIFMGDPPIFEQFITEVEI